MSDFLEIYKNEKVFMNTPDSFELVMCTRSLYKPSEPEMRMYVVQYILAITMWEREFKKTLDFSYIEMLDKIPKQYHERVAEAFMDVLDTGLLDKELLHVNELRIIKTPEKLQEAMDYCGSWYNGIEGDNFVIPEGVYFIKDDRDEYNKLAEEMGGHEVLHKSILIDIAANAPYTGTLN